MERRAGAGGVPAATLALVCAFAAALSGACADPTTAYHRQFEYLRRVGGEALEDGQLEDARDHYVEATSLASFAAATDFEQLDALTHLVAALRELGEFDGASGYAETANQLLGRQRLTGGGLLSPLAGVGGAWMLERARLEAATADLLSAEATLREFFVLRGDSGGEPREAAEAYWLLGELCLARGRTDEARNDFRRAAESVDAVIDAQDAMLASSILFRAAETELAVGRIAKARAWIDRSRPGGIATPASRTGLLLTLGLVDGAERNIDRALLRLDDSLERMSGEDPGATDVAVPARAIHLASLVYGSSGSKLQRVVARALAASRSGPPLRAIEAGREAFQVGSDLFDAGARAAGLGVMEQARQAIAVALEDRPHDLRTEVDFRLAQALARVDHLAEASARCDDLLAATPALAEEMRATHTRRLMLCGQIEARHDDPARAREIYGRAVMLAEESGLPPVVRLELLLRLAGLAHREGRDAEEQKLFERALVFVVPGIYDRLSELLGEAYGEQGPFQPSSAAARLAHTAARMPAHVLVASALQNVAEQLGDSPPASR
jgi:tetratricopeptide (TPR) repeat protein